MNIQLVTADNNIVTQSVSLVPISYPTNVNNSTALGDVIYFTNSPITASLVSTNYKVECNNEAHNNWYVIVSGSTFSSYSGSVYSGSICQVSMNLIDYLGNPFSGSVAISPLITNALFSGSTNSLILKDTLYYTASANGNLTASLLPLPYLFKAFGAIKHPKFTFYPTASCNINLCETTVTNIAPIITATNNSSYGYTAQASDARYLGINATASYATLSATASYFSGSISNANTSLSASYSTTSSYALNGGGSGTSLTTGSTYPITASISLTASAVTVNATATNNNYYLMFTPTTGSITPLIDSGLTSYYNPNTDTFTALHISASNVTASLNAANALVNNLIVTNYIQNTGNTTTNTNVIGNSAGVGSVGTYNNFIGNSAGNAANNASYSNFIGVSCGTSTNSASYSNFIGYDVGAYAINASQSNFIGWNAGVSSTNAYNSNFIGYRAGGSATNFNNAIAIGYQAGYGEFVNNNNGHSSILIGDFTLANGFKDSITIGKGTQNSAAGQCNIGNSLFINGIYSGSSTTSTPQLNITVGLGTNTPVNTLDVVGNISCSVITASLHLGTASYSNYSATASMLIGSIASASYATLAATASYFSGSISNATNAINSISSSYLSGSIGIVTSLTASNIVLTNYINNTGNTTNNSNVIGNSAGVGSVGTYNNFIGNSAGNAANNASYSNFIGVSCGTSTNSASYSNFIGYDVGAYAINASQSNFIGWNAGVSSTNAYNSNFIGYRAGGSATNFNNAIAIGYQAGYGEFVNNNNGHSSILIGDFTLANGFKDSITIGKGTQNSAAGQCNIGNSLFINGIYSGSSTTSTPQLNITVGLGTNTPVNTLDVVGNISCSVITASLHLGTASYSNYSATASMLIGSIASASYATLAATASYFSGSISNANTATTASYAATSSWPFFPVSSTQIETLQSVGIQTNNPLYPLHVYGPLMVEGNPTPRIYAKSNDGSNSLVFDRYTGQSSYAMYFGENADTGATYFRGAGNFYVGNQSTPAIFANGNTGQVGINNITSPVNSLDVNGNISCSVITASSLIGNTIVLNSTTYTSSSINTTIGSVLGGYSIINGGGNKISQLSVIAGTAVIPGTAQFSNINGNTVGIDSGGNLSASYNLYVNGSIIGNLTGSLLGTSSWATNVVNGASYNNTSSALLVSGSIGLTISQSTITANTSPTSSLPALNVETYWSGSTTSTYGSLIQGVANWTGSGLSAVSYLLDLRNYNPATAPNNFGFQVLSNGNIKLGTIGNQYCMMQFANSQMFLSANGSSTYDMALCTNGGYTLNVGSGNTFGWCSTAGANTLANVDTRLVRDAANTIGQRNGGNYTASVPQAYNLYNYYSASNDKQYLSSYWTGSNYYLQLFSTGSASGSANINLVTSGSVNITQQLQFTSSNSPALNVVSYISASSNTNPTMSLIAGTVNWSGSYLSSTNAYLLNLNAYNNTSSYGNYIFQVTPQGNVNMGSTQINQINNQASIMGFALGNTAGNNSVQFATNGGSIVSLGKGMNLGWSATTYAATLSGNDTLINRYSAGVVNISSSLMVNNISCSVITGSTLMQLPISSSAVIFNSSSNLITGSAYVLASATTPLFYVYLGTRWYSSSLA